MSDRLTCPRCGQDADQTYYGPCEKCRGELREMYSSAGREVDADAYEPKMNVTPNAVALKDD